MNTTNKTNIRKEKLAGFFFDLAKLVFAGLVVGSITPMFTDSFKWENIVFFVSGSYATFILARFANNCLK